LLPTAAACWAGNHVVARTIAGHAPPATLSVFRWLVVFAVVTVLAWPRIREDLPKLKAHAGVMVFLSLTGGAAFGTLQFVALQYTTALNMGVVGSVAPAFIVAASYLLFRDGLGPLQLFGVALSLAGVLAILCQLHPERLLALSFNIGDLLILLNMVFWATYCACLRLRPAVHPMSFLFVLAPVSALGTLPFALLEHALGFDIVADARTIGAILYAAFFTSLLAYLAWNRGVDLIGAPRASAFLHTIPLFSAVFATTLIGERLMLYHVIGFVLILGGVTLAARPAGRAHKVALAGDGSA
ncbi:MAG TPA: DMT family transporter, partial [Hyphomicrobiaceae bacterium]|nr:DMT family transporter [Hyphomicrobiaceae bacterium]